MFLSFFILLLWYFVYFIKLIVFEHFYFFKKIKKILVSCQLTLPSTLVLQVALFMCVHDLS